MTISELVAWLETLAEAEATIPARAVLVRLPSFEAPPPEQAPDAPAEPEGLLTVEEAAKRLGVSRRWIYRHARELPFTRRLTSGTLRFDPRGLDRWKETRR